jgi:hypothetical protein
LFSHKYRRGAAVPFQTPLGIVVLVIAAIAIVAISVGVSVGLTTHQSSASVEGKDHTED